MDDGDKPSNILPIDTGSVHRICSGQVVLTLATAAKELLENSIDAGATNIEIRLRAHGSELLEVSDNGSGVRSEDFKSLTLKHHTSKLRDFSGLTDVSTFGFRGEALSSLCALSDFSIVTRHKNASNATKLEYNHHGSLISQTPLARQHGTTVSIKRLFSTLPVRHKEFTKNIRKEFAKLINVLNAYCIISTNKRISVTNQASPNSKKTMLIQTDGNLCIKENIANVFGPKQVQSLIPFVLEEITKEISDEYNLKTIDQSFFKIDGFVSSSEHGLGRSTNDRQYLYINNRPCDHSKVVRLINEVYHYYNRYQFPFIALNIKLARDSVDVNVTPDKRQIFVQEEKLLLATLKASLSRMFENKSNIYRDSTVSNLSHMSATPSPQRFGASLDSCDISLKGNEPEETYSPSVPNLQSSILKLKRSFSRSFDDSLEQTPPPSKKQTKLDIAFGFTPKTQVSTEIEKSSKLTTQLSPIKNVLNFHTQDNSSNIVESCNDFSFSDQKDKKSQSNISQNSQIHEASLKINESKTETQQLLHVQQKNKELVLDISKPASAQFSTPLNENNSSNQPSVTPQSTSLPDMNNSVPSLLNHNTHESTARNTNEHTNYDACKSTNHISCEPISNSSESNSCLLNVSESKIDDKVSCYEQLHWSIDSVSMVTDKISVDDTDEKSFRNEETITNISVCLDGHTRKQDKKCSEISFSINNLKESLSAYTQKDKQTHERSCPTFRAKINPRENDLAEVELKKSVSKEMFKSMEMIGQFNLGFIIALHGDDLFIIDQHASDEKYNFEMLQQNHDVKSQKLVVPEQLELTASNENILIENLEVFKKNGFEFLINEDGPKNDRVRLVSKPVNRNWVFGKEDIDEMIFMLSEMPGVLCRPSRVRQMFASRSCRKSIMIGRALNRHEMKRLVSHMAEIDQPWNCPHGRPTMRHLLNFNRLNSIKIRN